MGMFETSDEAEQKFLESRRGFGQKFHLATGGKPKMPETTTKGVATTAGEAGIKPDLAEAKGKK
jgi:hypothetical protein